MGEAPPFRFEIRRSGPRLFDVAYAGHMGEGGTHVAQTEELVRAAPRSVGLVYEMAEFVSFHRSQVQAHGEMLIRLGDKVYGVALLHARPVVRFGAITVSLMSKTPIKTFDDRDEARVWLASVQPST